MNEDKRKSLRTQGRFDEKESIHKSKEKDKKKGNKSYAKDRNERHSLAKNENVEKKILRSEAKFETPKNDMNLHYEENSKYLFKELMPPKKAEEIKKPGTMILSETENGTSRIIYKPDFLDSAAAYELFTILQNTTKWGQHYLCIKGKEVKQPRLVAWYGPLPYEYSGVILEPAEFPPIIMNIKIKVEKLLKEYNMNVTLNSVLLNLYRDGHDSVAWHSDDELSMGICPTIASISLGEIRKFELRRKQNFLDDERNLKEADYFVNLKHGSLLIMDGCMQKDWEHRIPKEYHDKSPRINLTFRTVFSIDREINEVPHINCTNASNSKTNIPDEYEEEYFTHLNNGQNISNGQEFNKVQNFSPSSNSEYAPSPDENDLSLVNNLNNLSTNELPENEMIQHSNIVEPIKSDGNYINTQNYPPANIKNFYPECSVNGNHLQEIPFDSTNHVVISKPSYTHIQDNLDQTSINVSENFASHNWDKTLQSKTMPTITTMCTTHQGNVIPASMFNPPLPVTYYTTISEPSLISQGNNLPEPLYSNQMADKIIANNYVLDENFVGYANYYAPNYTTQMPYIPENVSCVELAEFHLQQMPNYPYPQIITILHSFINQLKLEYNSLHFNSSDKTDIDIYICLSNEIRTMENIKLIFNRLCNFVKSAYQKLHKVQINHIRQNFQPNYNQKFPSQRSNANQKEYRPRAKYIPPRLNNSTR